MKVVTAHTMHELDRRAINEYGIPGRELMEHAGTGCVQHILQSFGDSNNSRALIVAGKGNNGGDGYVIARQLHEKGWIVQVAILAERENIHGDALTNLVLLPDEIISFCPGPGEFAARHSTNINKADLIIDALLGTGLSNDVTGPYLEAIDLINGSGRRVMSVDIPSGVHGTTGRVLGKAIRADLTVTFEFAKLGHILYPGADHIGRLAVVNIGIPKQLSDEAVGYDFLNEELVAPLIRLRDRQSHKGTFGHSLIIAGSTGKTGAAALAANSAVRAGAGLVTLGVPERLHQILENKTTEVMTVPLTDDTKGHLTPLAIPLISDLLTGKSALAVGPGIGLDPDTVKLVHKLIEISPLPMVVDADGLNAIAQDLSVLKRKRSTKMILTPHPGEMARLIGASIPDVAAIRISIAQEFARTHDVYLVLKGARTIIAAPNGLVAINGSGNPGMASGGMGDLLTGVITALLGQGYSPLHACKAGVFVHGLAGDMVAADKGEIGMNATDLLEMLPYAFNRLAKMAVHPAIHVSDPH